MARLIAFVAQGLGTGRSPIAPGTFGTLLGFGWIYLLLIPRSVGFFVAGTMLGLLGAVWLGERAEEILKQKDPGSIVIDEIAALPIVFLPVVLIAQGISANECFRRYWFELILTFATFRLFDVWKPLGIRKSQSLPGGLVLDDVLAAMASAVILSLYIALRT